MITKLKIENPVWFERRQFPVGTGIPFAQGVLKNSDCIGIYDCNRRIPAQTKTLGKWRDGSIKWAYVLFLTDMKGQEVKDYGVRIEKAGGIKPENPLKRESLKGKVKIEDKKTRFIFTKDNLVEAILSGKGVLKSANIEVRDARDEIYNGAVEKIEIEEDGDLRTIVRMEGSHKNKDGKRFLDFVLRFYVHSNNTALRVDYKFINREEPEEGVKVKNIKVAFQFDSAGDITRTVRQMNRGIYWFPRYVSTKEKVDIIIDANGSYVRNMEILGENLDEYPIPLKKGLDAVFPWVDVCDDKSGISAEMFEALENYPKGIYCNANKIEFLVWPEREGLLQLNQGMGKMSTIHLCLYRGKLSKEDKNSNLVLWSNQLFVSFDPEYVGKCGVEAIDRSFKYQPEKHPKTELFFKQGYERRWDRGMIDFGDGKSGGIKWYNNENDFIWTAVNQYLRTGQYHAFYCARISARHQVDIDFIHYSQEKFRLYSTPAHSVYHTNGCSYPSHSWVEGLISFYFISGEKEYLEAAKAIGDNLLLWVNERTKVMLECEARMGGWMLIAFCSLYDGTGEKRYLAGARKIAEFFLKWKKKHGALLFPLGYYLGDKPFMTSVAMLGLKKYYLITKDEKIKKLFIDECDWLIENSFLPEGVMSYQKDIKNRINEGRFYPSNFSFAYALTGNGKYVKAGLREYENFFSGTRQITGPRPVSDTWSVSASYRTYIEFLKCADELGYLKKLEFIY